MNIWQWNISLWRMWILWMFGKSWLSRWSTTPISTRRHVAVQQNKNKKIHAFIGDCTYPCYWLWWKKGLAQKNTNTNNTSGISEIVKSAYEHVACVAWECGCSKSIAIFLFWKKLQAIMWLAEFSFFLSFFLSTLFHKIFNISLFKF